MPTPTLKVSAESVRKRAEASFDKRVETAAKTKLSRIDSVSKALVTATAKALEEHFAKQDKAGETPYPEYDQYGSRKYGVRITIEQEKLGRQAKNFEAAMQNSDESTAIEAEVVAALVDAGYEVHLQDYNPFQIFVTDPLFGRDE